MVIAGTLRKSILEAAIAGELTEQKESDGDARALLAAIRKEKARLVRAGKLKKERALPTIDESDVPFEIPGNWCWTRLGDVALKIHYGFTASANASGNAKLLRITDIQNNHVAWESVPFCTVAKTLLDDYRLKNRDIVIARTGGTIGKSYIVRELEETAVFASYLIRVIPSTNVNEEYLKRFMESPLYWKQLEAKSQGTGQPNVNGKALSNLMLPLPPLSEQERIVCFLQSLSPELTKLEADERELDALESSFPSQMKSSLLLAAMRGELTQREDSDGDARDLLKEIEREKKRLVKEKKLKKEKPLPPVEEDDAPFEIPANWCWVRLGTLTAPVEFPLADGPFGSNLKKEHYTTRPEVRIIQLSNIGQDGWRDDNKKYTTFEHLREIARSEVAPGDIVIAKMMPAGRAIIVPSATTKYVLSSDAVKFVPNKKLFLPYLLYAINSPVYQRQVTNEVHGVTRQRTSLSKLKNYLLPLPPLPEQRRIVRRLEELLPLCEM